MASPFRYRVQPDLLRAARNEYFRLHGLPTGTLYLSSKEDKFIKAVGITKAQFRAYMDSDILSVSESTYKKLELLASGRTDHWKTMFKVLTAMRIAGCYWHVEMPEIFYEHSRGGY